MKFLKFLGLALLASLANAATPKLGGNLANESGLSATKSFTIPMNSIGVDQVAFQVLWSSASPTAATFTDGTASSGTIIVSSSPKQGITAQTLCINSVCLTDGTQWNHSTLGISSVTALSIAAAINANTTLNQIIVATAPAGSSTIFTTSTVVGTSANYTTYSSSNAALSLRPLISSSSVTGIGNGAMVGGTNAGYTINQTVIFATNTWAPTGQTPMVALPVVYTTQTAVNITGLSPASTYYVIPINSQTFGLSTTSTGAVAGYAQLPNVSSTTQPGTFIALTSSRTLLTADGFKLTPTNYAGSPVGIWQVSNDGTNYTSYPSSGTLALGGTTNTATGDFGTVNFSWLRFSVTTAPTGGAEQLKIITNGKNSGL